jgi:Protein of unknown function (DUF3352)
MSEQQPPGGTPEYLEHTGGSPLPPEPAEPGEANGSRRGRRTWWIAGGAVALLGLGAGAWAAMGFFQQGSQPAEALPSSTIAYLSIDLDPAGGQKIDAFKTLNKFPAFKDEVGVDSVDELRHKIGEELVGQADCAGLDYDRDIDPWLGDRMAVAGVELDGDAAPQVVAVLQVTNEDEARAGIKKLDACDDSGTDPAVGFRDGWAVFAESQKNVDAVLSATDQGTLADDATYQKWTKAVGEAGVVNAYASPEAGRALANQLGGLLGGGMIPSPLGTSQTYTSSASAAYHSTLTTTGDDPFSKALSSFKGGAATLRFTGDGLEFAAAADGGSPQLSEVTGNTGGTLVQRLPDDTAAAAGITLPKGWLERELDQLSSVFGSTGMSQDDLTRELSQQTGLDVPADVETLLGSGLSISIGSDFDLEAAENSSDGSGLPIAVTVKGDPTGIQRVLDKIRAKVGDVAFLGSDTKDGLVAIGPSADYRQQVLGGGSLGDDDTFTSAIPDAGDASSLFYVDIDALEPSITKAAAGDQQTVDNVKPLRAVGMSSWNDNGVIRFSFKISTN